MIYKLCRRCKKTILHPATYCDKCLDKVNQDREKLKSIRESKYNKNRDPKYKAFYNSLGWRALKNKKMMDEQYRCERCKRLATEVHHIKPIQTKEGWELRLDYKNLLAVCVTCHNKEHDRFGRKKVKKDEAKTNSM